LDRNSIAMRSKIFIVVVPLNFDLPRAKILPSPFLD